MIQKIRLNKPYPQVITTNSPQYGITKGCDYILSLDKIEDSILQSLLTVKIVQLSDEDVSYPVDHTLLPESHIIILSIPRLTTDLLIPGNNYQIRIETNDISHQRILNLTVACFK